MNLAVFVLQNVQFRQKVHFLFRTQLCRRLAHVSSRYST